MVQYSAWLPAVFSLAACSILPGRLQYSAWLLCWASHWTARLCPLGKGNIKRPLTLHRGCHAMPGIQMDSGLCLSGRPAACRDICLLQVVRFISCVCQSDGAGLRHSADRLLLHTVAPGHRSSYWDKSAGRGGTVGPGRHHQARHCQARPASSCRSAGCTWLSQFK